MAYPYVGVTVNVDITAFLQNVRAAKRPFFLSFLYEAAHAANAVPEFRQRIVGGDIVEYAFCRTSHIVAKEDGTYAYCELDADMGLDQFLPYAMQRHEQARQGGDIDEGEMPTR
jgi:chloramphenicol O-acetyltransferase type A